MSKGFVNFKKALERFEKHDNSGCHREAVYKMAAVQTNINVIAQISDEKKRQMAVNRSCLLKIITTLRYLAVQGLAVRGSNDNTSNFTNLLKLRAEDSSEMRTWINRDGYRWCSHDVQNEILDLMSLAIQRNLVTRVKKAKYFGVMCDETPDASRKEQFVFCIRIVSDSLEPEEMFIGFYQVESTTSASLFRTVMDVLMRLDITVNDCRGQGYDGCPNVSGLYNGVQAKISELEERALFVHCLAHSLNLVAQDTIKSIPCCRDALSIVKEMITFVRDSPKRLSVFQSFQTDESTQLRPLCPTRWSVRFTSMNSILNNYRALVEFMETLSTKDRTDSGAKAAGFLRVLNSFNFYCVLNFLVKFFAHIDSVNTALQSIKINVEQGHRMVSTLKDTISHMKEDFESVWEQICLKKPEEVSPPELPRRRKKPKNLKADADSEYDKDPTKTHFRLIYESIIDEIVECIQWRFDTKAFKFMLKAEQFLLGQNDKKEEIASFYRDDINMESLLQQREMLFDIMNGKNKQRECLQSFIDMFKEEPSLKEVLPEVHKFLRLLMTIPVTSATAERSFSGLKRLKTFLRSTMTQQRLNSLAIINFHKAEAEGLNIDQIADEFITKSDIRKRTFSLCNLR
uniref:Zinc finger MYM-type protein 1 n=4 Tax=Culex pipiens TaxID=7175 RepID=A0A8D8ETT4_CULPI